MKITRALTCLLILLLTISCSNDTVSYPTNAPKDFKLKDIKSDRFYELKNFNGKPLILNFWASWCRPCREEMPLLERLSEQHKNSGLSIVGINLMDSKDNALKTLQEFNISYVNLFDGSGKTLKSYNIPALPITYLINKKGKIHYIQYGTFKGKLSENIFNTKLQEIL